MLAFAVAKYLPTVVDTLTFDETGPSGNLFVTWMPSTPDLCVGIMGQPGQPQLSKLPVDLPGLQVLVRGVRYDTRTPFDLARSIYSALNCLDNVTLDQGGDDEVRVIGCTALQSDPTSIGRDDNGRPEWSLNFAFRTYAPTAHRSLT